MKTKTNAEVIAQMNETLRAATSPKSTPITTTTPVDAEVAAIFARYFPDAAWGLGAHSEIDGAIKDAISAAFAAGRDFEGTRRDRRAQRDAKADAQRAKDAKAMGFETITEEGGSR